MKIFVDSSVIVEYIKGNQIDLLENLISSENELFVNAIVFSEFMFYYLAVIGEKSPLTLKESKLIKSIIDKHKPIELFQNFQSIPIDNEIINLTENSEDFYIFCNYLFSKSYFFFCYVIFFNKFVVFRCN